MILVQKGLIYHPVKKSAVDKEMHTQLGLATRVVSLYLTLVILVGVFGNITVLYGSLCRKVNTLSCLIFITTLSYNFLCLKLGGIGKDTMRLENFNSFAGYAVDNIMSELFILRHLNWTISLLFLYMG